MALMPSEDARAFALCRVAAIAKSRWTLERLLPQDESNVTITEPHIVSRMFPIA